MSEFLRISAVSDVKEQIFSDHQTDCLVLIRKWLTAYVSAVYCISIDRSLESEQQKCKSILKLIFFQQIPVQLLFTLFFSCGNTDKNIIEIKIS